MIIRASKTEYVFLALFLLLTGFFFNKLLQDKRYEESLEYFVGQGDSMIPTILDGEEVIADPNKKPEIGDIVVFSCEKCKINSDDIDILTKRLLRENLDGCYWVEGDNKGNSYDSRNFGWLCPDDIELYGAVLDKK
ncbi:MAG: S26 family signal peptidase [Candidatus Moranbacteria bacterium]|nr:S26 family signal peptidase [Candidatus Moranbacteria bacterium]